MIEKILIIAQLVIVIAITIVVIVRYQKKEKKNLFTHLLPISMVIVLLFCLVCGNFYLSPYNQNVPFSLYAELKLPDGHELNESWFWYAIYEAYGLRGKSVWAPDQGPMGGVYWPELNLDRHTYIVCFGQRLEELAYNPWEVIDTPIVTGAFKGYAKFEEGYDPTVIYIYQIPKIRIDNDF